MADKKSNPVLDLKELKINGEPVLVKLNKGVPVANGTSEKGKFGPRNWYLWSGMVKDAAVVEGKGKDAVKKTGYSGEVVFFPTEKLNVLLQAVTKGKDGVLVSIKKTISETPRGVVTNYEAENLGDGEISSPYEGLTEPEVALVKEAKKLKTSGFGLSEGIFLQASKEDKYKIEESRAKELFKLV